jgi:hypothetical protein
MLPLLPGAIELAQEGKMLLMTLTMMITAGAGRAAGQQGCSGKLVAAHQVSARSSRTSRRFLHTSSISNNHHHVSSPCTSPGVSPPGHPPPPHYCPRSQLRIHPRNSRCPRSHHRSWPSSGCTPPSWFPSCPVPCKLAFATKKRFWKEVHVVETAGTSCQASLRLSNYTSESIPTSSIAPMGVILCHSVELAKLATSS